VINDKSQGSVAAHSRCGGLFSYHFTKYLSLSFVVNFFKVVNVWLSYRRQNGCIVCPVCLAMIPLKDEKLAR